MPIAKVIVVELSAGIPATTSKAGVFELVEPGPDNFAVARIVTDPATTPVTTSVATPPLVELGAAKLTEPGPSV